MDRNLSVMGKFRQRLCRLVHPDTVRAIVTYLFAFAAILAFLVAVFAFTETKKAELIAGFFTGLLGVVLGYFFGERGANRAEQTAEGALRGVEKNLQSAQKAIGDARRAASLTPTAAEKLLLLARTERSANIRNRLVELSDDIEIEGDERTKTGVIDDDAIAQRLRAIQKTKGRWEKKIEGALGSITVLAPRGTE